MAAHVCVHAGTCVGVHTTQRTSQPKHCEAHDDMRSEAATGAVASH